MMVEKDPSPPEFQGRTVFMTLSNDIESWRDQNDVKCLQRAVEVQDYAREFAHGRWSSFGPGEEEKWYGTSESKPEGT